MSPRRQLGLIWGGVALAIVALSPLAPEMATRLPACPIRTAVDLPCLSCGTTRAALALSRLDPLAALAANPLAALGWTVLIAGGFVAGVAALVGWPLPQPPARPGNGVRWAAAAGLLANWAYLVFAGI